MSHLFSVTGDYLLILMYLLPTLCKSIVKLSPLTDKVQSSGHFLFPFLYEFFFSSPFNVNITLVFQEY